MDPYDNNPFTKAGPSTSNRPSFKNEYDAHKGLREATELVRAEHNAMQRVIRRTPCTAT